jgi:hypothetical protein
MKGQRGRVTLWSLCMCVCVRKRAKEIDKERCKAQNGKSLCVCMSERECVYECVCVCLSERESVYECVCMSERECVCMSERECA